MEAESAAMCRICLESNVDSGGCNPLLCGGEELIAPCQCRGTHQFVHRSCIDHWRSVKEGFAFAHCTTCKAQYHLRINISEGSCWRNIKFHMVVARDILLVFFAIQTMIALLGGLSYLCDLNGKFRNSFGHGLGHLFLNHPILFYYCFGMLLFLAFLGIYGLLRLCVSTPSNSNSHRPTGSTYCCCWDASAVDCVGSDSDNGAVCCALILMFVIIFAVIGIFYGIYAGTIGIQSIWEKHYHILTKRELTKEYVVEDLQGCYTAPNLDREHAERLRMLGLL